MIRVFHELLQPSLSNDYSLLLRVIILKLESLLLCISYNVLHVLLSESAKHSEEKVSFWQLIRELLFGWKVFVEYWISKGIIIKVLYRDFLVSRNIQSDDFILL